jgi:hypothetical protein
MRLSCLLRRHAAPNPYFARKNGDIWFGECPHCFADVVKSGRKRWGGVPRGYRVVWRPAAPRAIPIPVGDGPVVAYLPSPPV